MRSSAGGISAALIAIFLGVLVVAQVRTQEVYSRSLELETPASLTTLIAGLAERNSELRQEIFDLRLRTEQARTDAASGRGTLSEAQRQLDQLAVFAAGTPVSGPGITVSVEGPFDDKAFSDLVNELRNAGAEAIAVNDVRIGPRSWFSSGAGGAVAVDGRPVRGPLRVSAVGSPEVMYVAMTRTGGIVGQFELIYRSTHFGVARQTSLDLPALAAPVSG